MKANRFLVLVLLFSFMTSYAQVITPMDALKLRYNPKKNSATRVMVQDSITGVCGWILKSSLGGSGTSLPTQTGNSGKFLTTNGTTPSWATVATPNLQAVTSVSSGTQITNPIYSTQQIATYNSITSRGAGLSENGLVVAPNASNSVTINADLITANRTQQLPNKSGTFAMTSDVAAVQPTIADVLSYGNTSTDQTLKFRNTSDSDYKVDFDSFQARYFNTVAATESLITSDGIYGYNYFMKNGSLNRIICDETGVIVTYNQLILRASDYETSGLYGNLSGNGITATRNWALPDHDGTLATTSDIASSNTLDAILSNGNESLTPIYIGTGFADGLSLTHDYANLQGTNSTSEQQIGFSLDNFYVNYTDTTTGDYYESMLSAAFGLSLKTGTNPAGNATLKSDLATGTRTLQLPDESGTLITSSSVSSTYAPKASPTFTGTVSLPSNTSVGSVSSTELGYVDGVTSAIQTQIDAKASKVSITGATKTKLTYNNDGIVTAGADATTADIADSTDKRYVTDAYSTLLGTCTKSGLTTYSQSPTWTGTTAPSGATNFTYNWTKNDNKVTLNVTLVYATAGSALTAVVIPFPTGAPTPVNPTGLSSASEVLYIGQGRLSPSKTNTTATTALAAIRNNAANTGKEIIVQQASGSHTMAQATIEYFTN